MKKIFVAAALTLSPLVSFADPIVLRPGSHVVIYGQEVSCEALPGATLPLCSIRQSNSRYLLLVGETIVETFLSFNSAVEGAKTVRNAGLCR